MCGKNTARKKQPLQISFQIAFSARWRSISPPPVIPTGCPSESYTGRVGRATTTVRVLMRDQLLGRVFNVLAQALVDVGEDSCCHILSAAPRPPESKARTIRALSDALDGHA